MLLYVFYFVQPQHTKSNFVQPQTNIHLVQRQLFTYQDASSVAKKITEDILHKIYTEKGAIIGQSLVFSSVEVRKEFTCFHVATSQLMLGRRWLAIWVHSNSLIKNLTPFEDDAEIRLLNFLMQSICKQPEDTFIKMASLKIDFYFEVFKQLKNHVLSYLTGTTQHKDTGIY